MKNVKGLVLGIAAIVVFMFGVAPWLERLPWVRPVVKAIDERGIDASALYYTDIEQFADANLHMADTMDYPPQGP